MAHRMLEVCDVFRRGKEASEVWSSVLRGAERSNLKAWPRLLRKEHSQWR